MNPLTDYRRYTVLFVDDEAQALKYFRKTYEADFAIQTAASADEAWSLLQQHGDEIGVVIADQRMPGRPGVTLLEQVRTNFPAIVRMLTTAYSDLQNAVAAVNQGGAFRYVTKPWNIDGLRGDLLRAIEFHTLTRDRDRLLAEKLSVLQRILILDRIRGLTTVAAALQGRLRNSLGAVKAFVRQAMAQELVAFEPMELLRCDPWTLARTEAAAMVEGTHRVLAMVGEASSVPLEALQLHQLMVEGARRLGTELAGDGVTFHVEPAASLPSVMGNAGLVLRLLQLLASRIADMDGEDRCIRVHLQEVAGGSIQVTIASDGPPWSPRQRASLFSSAITRSEFPMGVDMDILAAFFIAHHHGGTLELLDEPAAGTGFQVRLAKDPAASPEETIDAPWFEEAFSHVERQLAYPSV